MNTWTGMPPHRTDDYIHFSVKPAQRKKDAAEYQAAYTAIEAAGLKAKLELLLEAAAEFGRTEEAESHVGECL